MMLKIFPADIIHILYNKCYPSVVHGGYTVSGICFDDTGGLWQIFWWRSEWHSRWIIIHYQYIHFAINRYFCSKYECRGSKNRESIQISGHLIWSLYDFVSYDNGLFHVWRHWRIQLALVHCICFVSNFCHCYNIPLIDMKHSTWTFALYLAFAILYKPNVDICKLQRSRLLLE